MSFYTLTFTDVPSTLLGPLSQWSRISSHPGYEPQGQVKAKGQVKAEDSVSIYPG